MKIPGNAKLVLDFQIGGKYKLGSTVLIEVSVVQLYNRELPNLQQPKL
ncbi:hypothetical protein JL09_g6466 [Pichia kudriavzevii]|uniref:Uncharacterized protein n=1 Tax=Pichia kudriavzevii TaxID=4909 RepID=A0A099NR28_PICKU|nr:hypothetical protein JL09_g6466 [Pichia kudriavzevii]